MRRLSLRNRITRIGVSGLSLIIMIASFTVPATVASAATAKPTWGTPSVTGITSSTANLSILATDNSSTHLTGLEFCYSTGTLKTATTSCASATTPATTVITTAATSPATVVQGTPGTLVLNLTGLMPSTKYYVRAGAIYTGTTYNFTTAFSFTTAAGPALNVLAPSAVSATSATMNASVDTVGVSSSVDFCYSTSSTLSNCGVSSGLVLTTPGVTYSTTAYVNISATVVGLAPLTTYYYEADDTTGGAYSPTKSFTTTATGELLSTTDATSVAATTATLNGSVNANGGGSATALFCYSTSSTLSNCANANVVPVLGTFTGTTFTPVSTSITGLTAATTYYFELEGVQGPTTYYSSPVGSFTTTGGPLASTPTASNITGTSATLGGQVTANGAAATVSFCYSTTPLTNCTSTSGSSYVGAQQSPVAATASNLAVSAVISSGLTPDTTYYYQVDVQNSTAIAYSSVATFTTIGAPFACGPNFYQVSATAPELYVFSPVTDKFTTLGNNSISGFNDLGYDGANNYMYVMKGTEMYIVDSTGTFTPIGATTNVQTTGGGFIGQSNYDLTTNGSGIFDVVNVASSPLTGVPFTFTTAPGSSSWGAADLTVVPNVSGGYNAYGMTGSTLDDLAIAGPTATSGVVSSQSVVSGTPGYTIPSGAYGAAYSDQQGDVFFFNNGDSEMWEITAAELAATSSSSTVTATLAVTSSPLLAAANDGASCPLSVNPFAPPNPVNDSYSLTLSGTNPVTVNTAGTGITANDQSGTPFAVSSVTFDGQTVTTPNTPIVDPGVGTLDVTDFTIGYFTFTPTTSSPAMVSFTYKLVQTGVAVPQTSPGSATVSLNLVATQSVNWSPTTSLLANTAPVTPSTMATTNGNGAITYTVANSPSNTAGCVVDPVLGTLTFNQAGTCAVTASAAGTTTYAPGSTTVTFTISPATAVITWPTDFSLLSSQSPYTPASGAVSSSGGAITYAVLATGNTAGCSNIAGSSSSLQLTFSSTGQCTVDVTSAATATYGATTATYVFTVSAAAATITWNPVTTVTANPGGPSFTPIAATTSGNGAITYAVADPGTSGCVVNATTGVIAYTGAGTCVVTATAGATANFAAASTTQAFVIAPTPQGVTWAPTMAITDAQSPFTPSTATAPGGNVTYAVTSFTTTTCSVDPLTGILTYTGVGNCVVTASSPATAFYEAASTTVTFTITLAAQTVTWTPTTTYYVTSTTASPASATTIGNGAITYSVTSAGTTGCVVNAATGVLTYSATGTCTVKATAAATSTYATGSASVSFVIALAPQVITWAPSTSVTPTATSSSSGSFTPSLPAATSGNGALTYAVSGTGNTAGCSIANSAIDVVSVISTGSCTIVSSAAASSTYAAATNVSVTFTVAAVPQVVSWNPTNLNPVSISSGTTSFTPSSGASDLGPVAITYSTTAPATICKILTASSDVITVGQSGSGSCPVTATAAATGLYGASSVTVTYDVTTSALAAQVITWSPTTTVTASSALNFTPASAIVTTPASGGGAVTYAASPGTSGCTVNASTGVVTYVRLGTCTVTATAAAVAGYAPAVASATFTIQAAASSVVWSPTTSVTTVQSPLTPSSLATNADGATPSYSVTSFTTTTCTVNPTTGVLSYTGVGNCVVTASTPATGIYAGASTPVTFTVAAVVQHITWSQAPTTLVTSATTTTLVPATTDGDGTITYAVTTTGTAVCSLNPTTMVLTYSGVGTCTVTPSASATPDDSGATGTGVTFTITLPTPTITWKPTVTYTATGTKVLTPTQLATTSGNGAITYTVLAGGNSAGCSWNVGGTLSYTQAGQCTVQAQSNATSSFAASAPVDVTFTITPIAQTVTWNPATDVATSQSPYTVSTLATALGGAPVTYTVMGYSTNSCTLNYTTGPNRLTLTYDGTGTCTVTASTPATGIYAAGSTSVTFNVHGLASVYTFAASSINAVGATLNGSVQSNGADTTTSFCLSTSATLSDCATTDSTPVQTIGALPGTVDASDPNAEDVDASLAGSLQLNTTYYYEVVGTNTYGTTYGTTFSFTTSSPPSAVTTPATNVGSSGSSATATVNGDVNADNADTTVSFCYGTTPSLGTCTAGQFDAYQNAGDTPFSADLTGLALGTTYYYEVVATNVAGTTDGAVHSFTTVDAPVVVTQPATGYSSSSATLNATVDPSGESVTSISFCYGTDPTLAGCTTVVATPGTLDGSANGPQSVVATITGPLSGVYYYRVSATNALGTTSGSIEEFNTSAANVALSAPSAVDTSSATLHGVVNPEGNPTVTSFCYSTSPVTTNRELANCTLSAYSGSDSSDDATNVPVTGLNPDTVYYVQLVGVSTVAGLPVDVHSQVLSFETLGDPTATTLGVTSLTATSATLNGATTAGGTTSTVTFCYGTDPSLANCTTVLGSPGVANGFDPTSTSFDLSGLAPGTTYYYDVEASNGIGDVTGAVQSFTTPNPPSATTGSSTHSGSGVTLNGAVNPNGGTTTTILICYSTSSTLARCATSDATAVNAVLVTPSSVSGVSATAVAGLIPVGSFVPGVTYYYEIEAVNAAGVGFGTVRSFTVPLITQVSPTSGSLLTTNESTFTDQLNVTGNTASPAFTENASVNSDKVIVSATGAISVVDTGLAPGVYTVTGTVTDADGDVGTWTYTLTVKGITIVQAAPTSGAVASTTSGGFSTQLATTGSDGHGVTFVESPSVDANYVVVSSSGHVTTSGNLPAGSYEVTGTTSDGSGDTGTWSYTLFVTNGTLSAATTTGTVATTSSPTYTTTIATSGSDGGPVTFTETSSTYSTDVVVSPAGVVTVQGALAVGAYTVGGTMSDVTGDTGTYAFTLYVTNGTLTTPSITANTTTANSVGYVDQLATTGSDGGSVTYTEKASVNSGNVIVSSTGAVSLPGAGLAVGSYVVTGTTSDSSGDVGTWSYTLYVTNGVLTQVPPSSNSVPNANTSTFTDQLNVSGSDGGAVTYTENAPNSTNVIVSSAGVVTLKAGLAVGTYTVTGSMSDSSGDVGTWTYTLSVTALSVAPMSGSTDVAGSAAFTTALTASGTTFPVTYVQTTGSAYLLMDNDGDITTTGTLAAGTYTATGTVSDGHGATGNWSYTLIVTADTIASSGSSATSVPQSATYSHNLGSSGGQGQVSFIQTTGFTYLSVSSAGVVTTNGTLPVGNYTVTGTTSDVDGDSGTFTYTLSVTPGALTTTPSADVVSVGGSTNYTTALVTTGNSGGAVTYAQTTGSTYLLMDNDGDITTTGTLAAGTYTATGTTSDPNGDTGSWSFTLTVTGNPITDTHDSGSVNAGSAFADTIAVSGNNAGPVSFTTTSGTAFSVDSNGNVVAPDTLTPGTYVLSGTDSDTLGDTGTWTYTLTVGPEGNTISDTHDAGLVNAGSPFTDTIAVTGNNGPVTFVTTSGTAFIVDSNGNVSAPDTLVPGKYVVSGTDSDAFGNTGTWTYTLTVGPEGNTISDVHDTGSVNAGSTFTDTIAVTGNNGPVTFVTTSGTAFSVDSNGNISAPDTLVPGKYVVSGTDSDAFGNTGTWTYTLTVGPEGNTISDVHDTGSVNAGSTFTDTITVTGNNGPVTFVTTSGTAFIVDSKGNVSAPDTLVPGKYVVSGTDSDTFGNTGTWSYTLTVGPEGNAISDVHDAGLVNAGSSFTDTIAVTGNNGPVTFVTTSGTAFVVDSNGNVSAPNTLVPGKYVVSGTDSDTFGNTGTWKYVLIVGTEGNTITDTHDSGSVNAGTSFSDTMAVTGNNGGVTFLTTSGTDFIVNGSGDVTAPDTLLPGTYVVSGIDYDAFGNTGTWTYTLTVGPEGHIITDTHDSGSVNAGTLFTDTVNVTGNNGPVTFVTTSGTAFTVDSNGNVSAPDTLVPGKYVVSGTDSDAFGNTGTWSYTLTVQPRGKTIKDVHDSGSVSAGSPFADTIVVTANDGPVTYTTTSGSVFTVDGSGNVAAAGSLVPGAYVVSGTDADSFGDTGTWTYTLTVGPEGGTISDLHSSNSVVAGATFSDTLSVAGNNGPVTFVTTSGSAFTVSSSGEVSAPATLTPATYVVSGTDSDSFGDHGTWTFTLVVGPEANTISVTGASGSTPQGTAYESTLGATGNNGPVTFVTTSLNNSFTVSSAGAVTAPDTLTPGAYVVSGTDSDAFGDTGTWTFTLTVAAPKSVVITVHSSDPLASVGTDYVPTVTSSTGAPVEVASNSPLVCTVDNGQVVLLSIGTCELVFTATGATPVTQAIIVGKHAVPVRKTVYFANNSWVISPGAKASLVRFAQKIYQNRDVRIIVVGFASSTGNKHANQILSNHRARIITAFLVATLHRLKLQGVRVSVLGKGATAFITANTKAGKNRRATIFAF